MWWSTEAVNNEYSVPRSDADCDDAATPAEACVHTIKSRFTGKDTLALGRGCMVSGDASACGDVARIAASGGAFQLVYAAAHCHAPACLSMELWDDDSGELLCRNVPTIGTGSAYAAGAHTGNALSTARVHSPLHALSAALVHSPLHACTLSTARVLRCARALSAALVHHLHATCALSSPWRVCTVCGAAHLTTRRVS